MLGYEPTRRTVVVVATLVRTDQLLFRRGRVVADLVGAGTFQVVEALLGGPGEDVVVAGSTWMKSSK